MSGVLSWAVGVAGLPLGALVGLVLGWITGRASGISEGRAREVLRAAVRDQPTPPRGHPGPRRPVPAWIDLDQDSMAELVAPTQPARAGGRPSGARGGQR